MIVDQHRGLHACDRCEKHIMFYDVIVISFLGEDIISSEQELCDNCLVKFIPDDVLIQRIRDRGYNVDTNNP